MDNPLKYFAELRDPRVERAAEVIARGKARGLKPRSGMILLVGMGWKLLYGDSSVTSIALTQA